MSKKKQVKKNELKKSKNRRRKETTNEFDQVVQSLKESGASPKNEDGIAVTVRTHCDPQILKKYVNKLNWKDHPNRQKKYIENSVNDAGWAKSVIFCANTMRVIDGHGPVSYTHLTLPTNREV